MRIIVISDSHGKRSSVDFALQAHPDARHVFFLGDNVRDIEAVKEFYTDRIFHIVNGNCDGDTFYPTTDICTLEGVKILFTHGHYHNVKYTTSLLQNAAEKAGAKIALYGHTHIAKNEYLDGLYLINPGSIAHSREGGNSYAVIAITPQGIMPIIIKL